MNALARERNHWFFGRRLWWYRPLGIDRGGQIPFFGNAIIDNALYRIRIGADRIMRKKKAVTRTQSCLIRDVLSRRVPAQESRLEIQFEGNIIMTYK